MITAVVVRVQLTAFEPFGDVEVGTGFAGIKVPMPADNPDGVVSAPVLYECGEAVHLGRCELVAADQANAKRAVVVSLAVSAGPVFGSAVLDDSVTPNDAVIADAIEVEGGLAMPGVDSLGPDVPVIRGVGTVYNDF